MIECCLCQIEPFDHPSDTREEAILKLRIPSWVVPQGSSVDLNNGEMVAKNEELEAGTYLSIKRRFKSGGLTFFFAFLGQAGAVEQALTSFAVFVPQTPLL